MRIVDKYGDLNVFMAFDYGQIEIRILAEMSGDKKLLAAINRGDIHAEVAHDITGEPVERFAKGKRRVMIKSVHFAMVYGKSPGNLYKQLRNEGVTTTEEEVERYFKSYFKTYKDVKKFIDYLRGFTDEKGYAETMFGFRREIAQHREGREDYEGAFWGNQAINSPIQGSAHQLVLTAMAELKRKPRTYWALDHLTMEVHDALYWVIPLRDLCVAYVQAKDLLEVQVKKGIKRRFGIKMKVPLLAEAKAGFRLGTMLDYEGESMGKFIKNWRELNRKSEQELKKSLAEMSL